MMGGRLRVPALRRQKPGMNPAGAGGCSAIRGDSGLGMFAAGMAGRLGTVPIWPYYRHKTMTAQILRA